MDPVPSSLPGPPDKKDSKPLRLCHGSQKANALHLVQSIILVHLDVIACNNCIHEGGSEVFLCVHRCNQSPHLTNISLHVSFFNELLT